MTIKETQEEIIDEFALFDEQMDKIQHLIDLGKGLPLIDEQYKTEENLIKGCQASVWLHTELKKGKIIFTADSDGIISKGIIALIIRVFSNQTPKDITTANLDFINQTGLKEHLSPTRSNGLVAMVKQIKMYALVYSSQLKSNQ